MKSEIAYLLRYNVASNVSSSLVGLCVLSST